MYCRMITRVGSVNVCPIFLLAMRTSKTYSRSNFQTCNTALLTTVPGCASPPTTVCFITGSLQILFTHFTPCPPLPLPTAILSSELRCVGFFLDSTRK